MKFEDLYGNIAPRLTNYLVSSGSSYAAPAPASSGYSAPAAPATDFSMLDSNDSELPF